MTRARERSGTRRVRVDVQRRMSLWDALPFVSPVVRTAARLPGHGGLAERGELIVATADLWREDRWLTVSAGAGDAYVYANCSHVGTIEASSSGRSVALPAKNGHLGLVTHSPTGASLRAPDGSPPEPAEGTAPTVDGRIGGALTSIREVTGWEVRALDLASIDGLRERLAWRAGGVRPVRGPVFCRGEIPETGADDLVLDATGWGRGLVWAGGVLVGAYGGPRGALRLPAGCLSHRADLVLLELEQHGRSTVALCAARD